MLITTLKKRNIGEKEWDLPYLVHILASPACYDPSSLAKLFPSSEISWGSFAPVLVVFAFRLEHFASSCLFQLDDPVCLPHRSDHSLLQTLINSHLLTLRSQHDWLRFMSVSLQLHRKSLMRVNFIDFYVHSLCTDHSHCPVNTGKYLSACH